MGKILNLVEMLEIAQGLGVPGCEDIIKQAEEVTQAAAKAVATAFGVNAEDAKWQGKSFGGLSVMFHPSFDGQPCPMSFAEADTFGEWNEKTVDG